MTNIQVNTFCSNIHSLMASTTVLPGYSLLFLTVVLLCRGPWGLSTGSLSGVVTVRKQQKRWEMVNKAMSLRGKDAKVGQRDCGSAAPHS